MEPAGRIEPRPWMTALDTVAVFTALTADGAKTRFVGGCVRDAVLGRPIKDIDLATEDPPEKVVQLLDRAGLKSVPTGIEHGTVTALSGGRRFEVTTLRVDVETFGRHARVAFTDDWAGDAARRDFTFNALYCDPDGTLYDPVHGLDDAYAGRVRFVGDPVRRIAEDRLRVLRFFRFHAWFGKGGLDPDGLAACRASADAVKDLSAERIRVELLRLLEASDPAPIIEIMIECRILDDILPQATRVSRLDRMVKIEAGLGLDDPIRRLAALLDVQGAQAVAQVAGVANRLRLSNAERDRLAAVLECDAVLDPSRRFGPEMSGPEVRRAHYRLGDPLFVDAALLTWADGQADPLAPAWRSFVKDALHREPPRFPLRGADALSLGVRAGPRVGVLLKQVEAWWVAGDFRADHAACREQMEKIIAAGRHGP